MGRNRERGKKLLSHEKHEAIEQRLNYYTACSRCLVGRLVGSIGEPDILLIEASSPCDTPYASLEEYGLRAMVPFDALALVKKINREIESEVVRLIDQAARLLVDSRIEGGRRILLACEEARALDYVNCWNGPTVLSEKGRFARLYFEYRPSVLVVKAEVWDGAEGSPVTWVPIAQLPAGVRVPESDLRESLSWDGEDCLVLTRGDNRCWRFNI